MNSGASQFRIVTQISDLLYRRASSLQTGRIYESPEKVLRLPIGNRQAQNFL